MKYNVPSVLIVPAVTPSTFSERSSHPRRWMSHLLSRTSNPSVTTAILFSHSCNSISNGNNLVVYTVPASVIACTPIPPRSLWTTSNPSPRHSTVIPSPPVRRCINRRVIHRSSPRHLCNATLNFSFTCCHDFDYIHPCIVTRSFTHPSIILPRSSFFSFVNSSIFLLLATSNYDLLSIPLFL